MRSAISSDALLFIGQGLQVFGSLKKLPAHVVQRYLSSKGTNLVSTLTVLGSLVVGRHVQARAIQPSDPYRLDAATERNTISAGHCNSSRWH